MKHYHQDYPGPYYLRIFVNFIQSPTDQWTSGLNLQAEADAVKNTLNTAFNKHNIYFVSDADLCTQPSFQMIQTSLLSSGVKSIREQIDSASHLNALDIYVIGSAGSLVGAEYHTPNNFCEIKGNRDGVLVTRTEVLVHEIGHNLGLVHTFWPTGSEGCAETLGACGTDAPCNCCGDYVCDTDPHSDGSISANTNCGHGTLPEHIVRNYMSYTTPGDCRDRFTPEQAKRMRAYLEESAVLQGAQIKAVKIPGDTVTSPSGNIVVESGELIISSPLEMLPGATIRVKIGAKLKVQSTITGACDQMWQGIIVEGNVFDAQDPALQGQVIVPNVGKIQHARVGIDVQDTDASGETIDGTGGGLVHVASGQFEDCVIGIRFGLYPDTNKSYFSHPVFSTTDDYRGGAIRPVYLQLNVVRGLHITLGLFRDLRTQCPAPHLRAIGIDARDSGFRVSFSSLFQGLHTGILADKLTESNGSMSVSGTNFVGCYKEIELISSSSFAIFNNNFEVKKPDACPSLSVDIIGVQIRGETTGFTFTGNDFFHVGALDTIAETLIGTDCIKLMDGLGNTIFDNTYSNLFIGNRASGDNGYDGDGLLYLCNTNENNNGLADFRLTGSIRRVQGDIVPGQPTRPTGNTFTADYTQHCTIENLGQEIEYHFYNGDPAQDPGIADSSGFLCVLGFEGEPVGQPNGNCADPEPPCFPCPEIVAETFKTSFHQNRQQWLTKTAAFPSITDSVQRAAAADSIWHLRLAMNRDGSRVLMQYSLDTLNIEVDSITHWLAMIQTYQTDLRLARHYFFTGDYTAFDNLWGQIPAKYELDEDDEGEFEHLGEVYDTLRAHLQPGGRLDQLPDATVNALKIWATQCDEPGFLSEVVLRRNGVEQSPDCTEEEERPIVSTSNMPSENQLAVKIYPNPTTSTLNVEYPEFIEQGRLRLFNLQGQTVSNIALFEKSSRISIQVSHLAPGVYLVELHHSQGLPFRKKIVISQ